MKTHGKVPGSISGERDGSDSREVNNRGSTGFVVSIGVAGAGAILHLATFVTDIPQAHALLVVLTLGAITCVLAMAITSPARKRPGLTKSGDMETEVAAEIQRSVGILKRVPPMAAVSFAVLGIYFTIRFFLLIGFMWAGSPEQLNGDLFLMDHGRLVRHLDVSEFRHLQTLEVRGLSGHSVMIALIAVIGFFIRRPGSSVAALSERR